MAATVRTLSQFDKKTWEEYCDIPTDIFTAKDVTNDDKKRAILLSSVGPFIYSLMRNLLLPKKPSGKTSGELVNLLQNYFNPAPSGAF